jgi:hypothetical protein
MMAGRLESIRDQLEPGSCHIQTINECALISIAISLVRIADVLTPADGASTCDLVQQISEMLADHKAGAQ